MKTIVIHTRSRIVEESLAYFLNSGDKIVDIYTYPDQYMRDFDFEQAHHYADLKIGKKYDTLTLFVQAIYIITTGIARLFGTSYSRGIWIGPKGKKAEERHVCSELAANVVNYGMRYKFYSKPYLTTTNDLTDDPRSIAVKRLHTGDIISTKDLSAYGRFFFFAEHTLFTWKNLPMCILSWLIRRFTFSWGNHSGVIFINE